jgi:hypothetical protein
VTCCGALPQPRSSRAQAAATTADSLLPLSTILTKALMALGQALRASSWISRMTGGRPLGLPLWPGLQRAFSGGFLRMVLFFPCFRVHLDAANVLIYQGLYDDVCGIPSLRSDVFAGMRSVACQ